jgi:two-component system C4-dicarboxylate transport sensor histidine kinase DctB
MSGPRRADPAPEPALAAAHARFARAVMGIYLGTAAAGIGLLVLTLANDRAHQDDEARARISLETQLRAQYLSHHLHLLVEELTRLGLRSEVNLLDANMEPERSLLRLSHENSAFFNVGIAILDLDGRVLWSEPRPFLSEGWPGGGALVASLRRSKNTEIVSGRPPSNTRAVLFLGTPILRGGQFTGALVGAVDLASDRTLEGSVGNPGRVLALASSEGRLVYPPGSPAFGQDPAFRTLAESTAPFLVSARLAGKDKVVAGAHVEGTSFTLMSLADAEALFGPARLRLVTRLSWGLVVASVPLLGLLVLLRTSLVTFHSSEEALLRNERLRALGVAVDLIAHEVKNALNGLRVGLDIVVRGEPELEKRKRPALLGLRTEIERLSEFTSELLGFSKGVVPRRVPLELGEFVGRVAELQRDTAQSRGVVLDVRAPRDKVPVNADSALVHVVVANLVGNALDFASSGAATPPEVVVAVDASRGRARVRVSDTGPGVAEAVRPRLFEPFAAGRPSGVGIGLAFSRTIARAHGGDLVLAEGEPRTTFELELPMESR